jgi:hypothetical protein
VLFSRRALFEEGNCQSLLGAIPPDNDDFRPTDTLTRTQMASFFVRALGL